MKCTNYKRLLGLFFVSISTLSLAKVDAEGNNLLMQAARQGDSKQVGRLLLIEYSGSNINNQNNNGHTALMLAVMSRDVPTVQKLLMYNIINLDIVNKVGLTALNLALELAAGNEGDQMVQLIKNHRLRRVGSRNGGERKASSPKSSFNYTF